MSGLLNKAQRNALIAACVGDFLDVVRSDEGADYAEGVAKHGFVGFTKMTDRQLIETAQVQQLDDVLEAEQVPELSPEPKLSKSQRKALVAALVARFVAICHEESLDSPWFESIATNGFRPYADWPDTELIREAKKAGIEVPTPRGKAR